MIIHDYDDKTKALIDMTDFYGPKGHMLEKCVIVLSIELYNYLLENNDCEHIATIDACNGGRPIYKMNYDGEDIAFYLSCTGSSMAASNCYEAHWLTGATKFVMFGSCGSLNGEKTKGRFIVPSEIYRGDGASYYFAPASDYLEMKNSNAVAEFFAKKNIPYVQGKVWTTDSMIRETIGLVEKRREEGCIAVEMELAGVESICDYYGLDLYDFLEAGDVFGDGDYEPEGLSNANHSLGKLFIGLDLIRSL